MATRETFLRQFAVSLCSVAILTPCRRSDWALSRQWLEQSESAAYLGPAVANKVLLRGIVWQEESQPG